MSLVPPVSFDKMFPVEYTAFMRYEIHSTDTFNKWFGKLKDYKVKQQVLARFARLENGNLGDVKQLGQHLFELRFFFAGGLRVYYTLQGKKIILLLTGGDKSSQDKDITKAEQILNDMEQPHHG